MSAAAETTNKTNDDAHPFPPSVTWGSIVGIASAVFSVLAWIIPPVGLVIGITGLICARRYGNGILVVCLNIAGIILSVANGIGGALIAINNL